MMHLKILLPLEILVEEPVNKVNAEGENGFFCLKPRHVDFTSALVPGLFSYENEKGEEVFLAVDEGVLLKIGDQVLVSVRHAMRGPDLGHLRQVVREQFEVLDDKEKQARSATARIEANFVRRFLEIDRL